MALTGFLALFFFLIVAFNFGEGLWGNLIVLVNVATAILLACNLWEPAARMIEGAIGGGLSYFLDMALIYILFAFFCLLMKLICKKISKTKVRFQPLVDKIGSGILAAVIGAVMVCFITFTLHMAPMGKEFLFGSFRSDSRMVMGLAPDRICLAYLQFASKGPFHRFGGTEDQTFDPKNEFIAKYQARRAELEANAESRATFVAANPKPR